MAKDIFHNSVVKALEKEGWNITDDPFSFRLDKVLFRMDLGAERIVCAEKGTEKIIVEIKSFVQASFIHAFHEATGQYDNYRIALEDVAPEKILYLAIPETVWKTYCQEKFIQKVFDRKDIKIIVYDPKNETIVLWKN